MSEVKVNKISPRTNCGTVQLGDSGDTITIPAGATITNNGTQTGFGRTGTVDWQTSIKTTSFTAVSGEGYFINTTSGAVTMTLPASPSVGDIVAFKDYAGTFDTNNLTINRNGSNVIGGTSNPIISVEGQAGTLVYGDATQGWQIVEAATDADLPRPAFVAATGGTITTVCTNFKVHTFTGPGTFTVTCAGNSQGSNTVDYLVVGGGGGGGGSGGNVGGGAGGGAVMVSATTYSGPSLANCVAAHPVSAQAYPITVGAGGTAGSCGGGGPYGTSGQNSIFSTLIAAGGGRGGCGGEAPNPTSCGSSPQGDTPSRAPGNGSGGGGAEGNNASGSPGGANGNPGGSGSPPTGGGAGGGGGATAAGSPTPGIYGGAGGAGDTTTITGTPAVKGLGGFGSGDFPGGPVSPPGPANSGEGGSGSGFPGGTGATGGSGIVIIRYKFQ